MTAPAGLKVTSRTIKFSTEICLGPARRGCPDHWMDEGPDAARRARAHVIANPGHEMKTVRMLEKISVYTPPELADPAPPRRSEPRPAPVAPAIDKSWSAFSAAQARADAAYAATHPSAAPVVGPAAPGSLRAVTFPLYRPGPAAQPGTPPPGAGTTDRPGSGRARDANATEIIRRPGPSSERELCFTSSVPPDPPRLRVRWRRVAVLVLIALVLAVAVVAAATLTGGTT